MKVTTEDIIKALTNDKVCCANCKYNDGLVYISLPPKYRCTIDNEFHYGGESCDKGEIKNGNN